MTLIQDLHAAISRRDWHAVEVAANRLRDANLEADNAALTGRIKELDKTVISLLSAINRVIDPAPGLRSMPLPEWAQGILSAAYVAWKDKPTFHIDKEQTEALEAKLATAIKLMGEARETREALEAKLAAAEKAIKGAMELIQAHNSGSELTNAGQIISDLRAVPGGKPS